MIDKFISYYFFLSNFYPHRIIYPIAGCKGGSWTIDSEPKEYLSVEHAYQAYKADNEAEHEYIRNLDTAGKAKRAGKLVSMRKDWEEIKYNLMLDLVRTKFKDTGLSKKLVETNDEILVEGNDWHDNKFGQCYCEKCKDIKGLNMLGKILMQVRNEIKK